ncbi:hypothetical protein HQN89_11115 [Paenibacillus frigoriresistens]|uniref:hypothetical protein n=1 Tax=Paenibacillus alginolyticus TaxID=59839 RepID=UPI001564C1A3|nr:hypothetical protein [Paenibacillus frigoriresistens]NRF91569.1 hypothetical protein [Paenibacillus frigoriresistens]
MNKVEMFEDESLYSILVRISDENDCDTIKRIYDIADLPFNNSPFYYQLSKITIDSLTGLSEAAKIN